MNDILRKIRTDLRLSMNGIIATSMREKGANYRMNFGVDVPKLRSIAKNYTPDAALAEMLWDENTRELKILATMLYPAEKLSLETASRWCAEIPNQEIREQACINLFQKLVFADKLLQLWIRNTNENVRSTGYWLYARLALTRPEIFEKIDRNTIVEKSLEDLVADSYTLRMAALNALKFAGRKSKTTANTILTAIQDFADSDDPVKTEIYYSLKFEFLNFHA